MKKLLILTLLLGVLFVPIACDSVGSSMRTH